MICISKDFVLDMLQVHYLLQIRLCCLRFYSQVKYFVSVASQARKQVQFRMIIVTHARLGHKRRYLVANHGIFSEIAASMLALLKAILESGQSLVGFITANPADIVLVVPLYYVLLELECVINTVVGVLNNIRFRVESQ